MISNILLIIVAFTVVTFIPIWLLAKVANAERSSWWASLLAALQIGVLFALSQSEYLSNGYIRSAFQLLGSAAIYTYTLRTSFFRSMAISILVIAVIVTVIYLIGGSNLSVNLSQ